MVQSHGFVQSIKWNFFTDDPVVHSAVGERPPLYPVLLSFILRQGGGLLTIDLLNVLLGAAGVASLFLLYRKILNNDWLAFLGAGLVAINPSMAKSCVYPWTEPLFILLQTLTFLFVLLGLQRFDQLKAGIANSDEKKAASHREKIQKRGEYYLLAAGFVAALAYLTRPNALALMAAIFLLMVLRRHWRALFLFLFPCVIILAIWFAVVWKVKGDPFYSVQNQHFRVENITDGMRKGWGKVIPTAAEFRKTHPVVKLIAVNTWEYVKDLYFLFLWLLPLGLLALPAMIKRRGVGLLGLAGLLHFVMISLVWSTHEPDRLLEPVFVCLLPLCLGAPFAAWEWFMARRQVAPRTRLISWVTTVVIVVGLAGAWSIQNWIDIPRWRDYLGGLSPIPELDRDQRVWNNKVLPENCIIATDEPFICNWRMNRPTIYLPDGINADNAESFLRQYSVQLIAVINPRDPMSRAAIDAMQQRGFLQPVSRGFDPIFQWFHVNDSIFLSPGTKPEK